MAIANLHRMTEEERKEALGNEYTGSLKEEKKIETKPKEKKE